MQIKSIYKRRGPGAVLAALVATPFLIITAMVFGGDEDDLFMVLQTNRKLTENQSVYNSTLQRYEGSEDPNGDATLEGATTGYGLNLNLINNIQTECYIKELLSLAKESQEGTLSVTPLVRNIPVSTILGIWVTETGTYDGDAILRSYLPWDSANHAPVWNVADYGLTAAQMTLKGCSEEAAHILASNNISSAQTLTTGAARGPLQYEPGNATPGVSKYTPNTGEIDMNRTTGDLYFTPDQIAGLGCFCNEVFANLGITEAQQKAMSDEAFAITAALSHNKGAWGCINMMFGRYAGTGTGNFDKSGTAAEDYLYGVEILAKDLKEVTKNVKDYGKFTLYAQDDKVFALVALARAGWNLDVRAWEHIESNQTAAVNAWRLMDGLTGDDLINSGVTWNEIKDEIYSRVATMSEATGYSNAECAAMYKLNADGSFWTQAFGAEFNSRFAFKVLDRQTSVLQSCDASVTAGSRKMIMVLDRTSLQHALWVSSGAADALYAKLLQYAGVNVDLTNPDTFYNKIIIPNSEGNTSDEWTGDYKSAVEELETYGVNFSGVSDDRMKLMNAAHSLLGIEYIQCRHFEGCDNHCYDSVDRPTHLDCTAFVWRTYSDAGFSMAGFPKSTGVYPGSVFERVESRTEALPGDVIHYRGTNSGHAMIFVADFGEEYLVMHASNDDIPSLIEVKRWSSLPSYFNIWRYIGIDATASN